MSVSESGFGQAFDQAVELARTGRLYPGVILHGSDQGGRVAAALELARTLLCERPGPERPCGADSDTPCTHCRRLRVDTAGSTEESFHPDFRFVAQDLKTTTSVDAVREALTAIQFSPFEARGQVFVVAAAQTLHPSGADTLLKSLEEPPTSAPRNFLLLAPSEVDLPETLRSRSLAIYLGPAAQLDEQDLADAARQFGQALDGWLADGGGVHLQAMAASLLLVDDWRDARSMRPWSRAARVVTDRGLECPSEQDRARLFRLAQLLLEAPEMRLRSIQAPRLVEGLVARAFTG